VYKKVAGVCVAAFAVLMIAVIAAPAVKAQNQNLDFKLVNKTGVEIHQVYLCPSDSDEWGDDVLGKDTLPDGESVEITFHPKAKAAHWDLRIEDKGGDHVEWENLDLSKIEVLTIKIVKGKPIAEWK
jgi:hypothetical protein